MVPSKPDGDDDNTSQEEHHHGDNKDDSREYTSTTKEDKLQEDFAQDGAHDNEDKGAVEKADQEDICLTSSTRPTTEGMHLNLDGTEEREPSGDGCADLKDISPTSQGAHCPSPESQRSSTRQSSYSPYGSTGFPILHIEPQAGGPLMATLLHETDVQNGNDVDPTYETPTASSRPPVPTVRCLPTGSSQEDEDVEEKADSLRASPVGQEDAVQAALYEDIAELEEKVRFVSCY